MSSHAIVVEKKSQRKLTTSKVVAQIMGMIDRAKKGRSGWKLDFEAQTPRFKNNTWIYRYTINAAYTDKTTRGDDWITQNVNAISKLIAVAGATPKWNVISVNGQEAQEILPAKVNDEGQEMVDYCPVIIPDNWLSNFDHIYDRADQISIIHAHIQAAIDSNWTNRFHTALVGEPAGGKTETARAFRRVLGDAAVLELDGTATTMAGVIKTLDERRKERQVPRVIIIEEIEKADFKQYPWLLAMLDPRAEIKKINFTKKIHMEAKMLCIATVNNYGVFKNALEGALASRFAEPIFFPRPTDDTLRKILMRDVAKVNGNPKWIDPALEYAKKVDMNDPRHILAVCLAGKDELLTRRYQEKLEKTRIPKDYYKG